MASHKIEISQINLHRCKEACDLLNRRLAAQRVPIALVQEPHAHNNIMNHLQHERLRVFQGSTETRACVITGKASHAHMLPLFSNGDQVAVQMRLDLTPNAIVASVYMPYDSSLPPPGRLFEDLVERCVNTNTPLLVGCDANSQCVVWGSTKTNQRGQSLLEDLLPANLHIINLGNEPTFVTAARREVIDISLCSNNLRPFIHGWRVCGEESLSDHRYLTFWMNAPPKEVTSIRNRRKTDWGSFHDSLLVPLYSLSPVHSTTELDRAAAELSARLVHSFESACPLTGVKDNPSTSIWWSDELSRLRKTTTIFNRRIESIFFTLTSKLPRYTKK